MATNPLPQQLAAEAEHIVDTLTDTYYQHVDDIDPLQRKYYCDCNGFVAFVLQKLAPSHYAKLPKEHTQPRPRAFEYYNFFASLTPGSTSGWHPVLSLLDARRADILAWRFGEITPGHDTGHVMFVAASPTKDHSGLVSVQVYDSANTAHFDDTRGDDEDQFPTGVGSGVLKFHVSAAGKPLSFQFEPGGSFHTTPIAVGRAEPFGV